MIVPFQLNGRPKRPDILPHRRLSHLLREEFGLGSVHRSCRNGRCGHCLVLLDDDPVDSCLIPAFELRDKVIWTAEGLSELDGFADIVEGFKKAGTHLCDDCAPARGVAAEALLRFTLRPTASQAKEAALSVSCVCSPVSRIIDGLLRAARARERRLHEK